MRKIDYLVVHCTATQPNTSVSAIQNYWRNTLKWQSAGYHYIVLADGTIQQLQAIEKPTNGVKGYNANSIHISYIGGIDKAGKPLDTRTEAQKVALRKQLRLLKDKFPNAKILGHRDFPNVKKSCPSFDAKKEYSDLKI